MPRNPLAFLTEEGYTKVADAWTLILEPILRSPIRPSQVLACVAAYKCMLIYHQLDEESDLYEEANKTLQEDAEEKRMVDIRSREAF